MQTESLKEVVRRELPALLREDPEFREYVLDVARVEFAPRGETQDRFDRLLAELKRDREAQTKKWEEQRAERDRDREEQNRKWEEQNRKWDEQNRKWGEQNRKGCGLDKMCF